MDLAMIILSALSIIVSIIALCVSYNAVKEGNYISIVANDLTKTANELLKSQTEMQKAQVEMQIREMISRARSRYQDKAFEMKGCENEALNKAIAESAHEDVLNAYDEACAKYLDDGKVDKVRFKKLYVDEIRRLVEDSANIEKYHEPQTKYHATNKVYKEWNDLEN